MLRIPRASLSAIYIKISSLIFGLYIADKNLLPVRLSKIRHTVSQNRGNFFISNLFLFFNARESPHGKLNHPQRHPQESPLPHMIILSICSPISLIKSTTNAFPIVKYLFEFVIPSNSVHPSGKVLILSVSIGERTLNRLLPGSLTT